MRIVAHCFAYKVKINPLPIRFEFNGYDVAIASHIHEGEEGLILEISRQIDPMDLAMEGNSDEHFPQNQMRPYQETLLQISQLIEGIISIYFDSITPKFVWDEAVVNIQIENDEERELMKSGKIIQGFGVVMRSPKRPSYEWNDDLTTAINKAKNHLPALFFLSQAIRSQDRQDQEVAFFLYFRIIDGYFSEGAAKVERALLDKSSELSKYLGYNDQIIETISSILDKLRLKSKSHQNFEGLISDIVLIRHKLTHFSGPNAITHHRPEIILDLNIINFYLKNACIKLLYEAIND